MLTSLFKALRAIAEGYPITVMEDNYILVENPDFEPDNGHSPMLLIDCTAIELELK